ncbi:MAG: UDP-2,4-diacetamido-2,4,6-trideoxy-beta-L-altropyranose hydrolase [Planctomycetota bacterium]
MARTLLIRADAGEGIGIGHVMRTLALAQAWQAGGGGATVLSHCRAKAVRERVRAAGIPLESLTGRHPDPADLPATLAFLERLASSDGQAPAPWVALDGYHFDEAYQQAIRQSGCRLLVIDDKPRLPRYHADLLVDQNLGAEGLDYLCEETALLLFGPRYALLRPEFRRHDALRPEPPAAARKVLVTLGGEDPANVTRLVLRALARLDWPELEARVVVGPANPHLETLRVKAADLSGSVEILTNVSEMPELMAWADVAVSAAGSTCYELAAMQLPVAVIVLADNQEIVAQRLSEAGAVVNLGRAGRLRAEGIAERLETLFKNRSLRMRLSESGRRLVDRRGAERVVAVMHALDDGIPQDGLVLRPVAASDARAVWRLANAASVRHNSLSSEPILWDEHAAWFREKLDAADTSTWVLGLFGLLVGQIRYDRVDAETAEISFSVVAPFRGRGLGSRLLCQTSRLAGDQLAVGRLRAMVRHGNAASARIFSKAGFDEAGQREVGGRAFQVFEREV